MSKEVCEFTDAAGWNRDGIGPQTRVGALEPGSLG